MKTRTPIQRRSFASNVRGFTMLELVITMAIVGIIAALLITNLGSVNQAAQVRTAARCMEGLLNNAKAEARVRNTFMRLEHTNAANDWSGTLTLCSTANNAQTCTASIAANAANLVETAVCGNPIVGPTANTPGVPNNLIYNPNNYGFPIINGTQSFIVCSANDNDAFQITLNVTGLVTRQELDNSNNQVC